MREEEAPAIGIDLGTWKCCVGVVRDGRVEIIENERGNKTTPSYVAFTDTERLVGDDARSQALVNCTNTVFSVKRIIGRRFDDSSLQYDINTVFPFAVKPEKEKTVIEVSYKEKKKALLPEQVSAMLLTKMKHIAESHLGCEVRDAVISVPAYFNNSQRQATKDAGAIAGLNVLGLINEPTAAALAYQDNKGYSNETICFVDLGGGSVDISIIQLGENGNVQVKQVSGNTSLGGVDFDMCMVKHFLEEYAADTGQDISKNRKAVLRLQMASTQLKHTLTLLRSGKTQIDCLANDTDFELSLTRDNFNSIAGRLFTLLEDLLQVSKSGIHLQSAKKIVLIGGATRIPYVQQILKRVFDGKKFDQSVNPDEAIAHGAAIYASQLRLGQSLVREVHPHEIILITEDNDELPLLVGHAPVPRLEYMPWEDLKMYNQKVFFSEEQKFPNRNPVKTDLGVVDAADQGQANSGLLYGFDKDGLFVADLVRKSNERLLYSRSSVSQMREEEKKFEKDDQREKERVRALNCVEAFCSKNRSRAREVSKEPQLKDACEAFMQECDDTMKWVEDNPNATRAGCKEKLRKLDSKIKLLSGLVSEANYPADYLKYEGHPNLLDEQTSDESSSTELAQDHNESVRTRSKKGKNKFHSAPSRRMKGRPSLPALEGAEPSEATSDSDDPTQQRNKSRRSSSRKPKRNSSKFSTAPTSRKKGRASVREDHFTHYTPQDGGTEDVVNSRVHEPNRGKSKKQGCSIL